jgi:hypothetical protein
MRRIWQRSPGNKYEEHTSSEQVSGSLPASYLYGSIADTWWRGDVVVCAQELFQDFQFIDPESEYEVAIKLGPLPTANDAKKVTDEWKKLSKQHFQARTCVMPATVPCVVTV